MILIIDNYDSFTYNLVQYVGEINDNLQVIRNDEQSIDALKKRNDIDRIIISPGPGRPSDAGITIPIIQEFYQTHPILGVCLGHQAIGEAFGGSITYADQIMHGKTSPIHHNQNGIFNTIPTPFDATRYHSLVIDPSTFPHNHLAITATLHPIDTTTDQPTIDSTNIIMGIQHCRFPTIGIQFHPESILTDHGKQLIQNFLTIAPVKK